MATSGDFLMATGIRVEPWVHGLDERLDRLAGLDKVGRAREIGGATLRQSQP